jgi:eukaryotic-like serine/threonine-protein kinase
MKISSSQTADCPSEEQLLRYPLGLSEAARGEVGAHLRTCSLCRSLIATATSDAPQRIHGRYRIVGRLGNGASATVYRAVDEQLGVEVALKLFRESGNGVRELVVARGVQHINACRVFDSGQADGASYMTMEYVEGETLAATFARGGTLDPHHVFAQVVAGLRAAHEAGVIHRDLKPHNILVATTGRVVITDFGLARHIDDAESRARLIGTPAFWAPEQGRGEPATFASDVYSVGLIAYRLWSGSDYKLSDRDPFAALPKRSRAVIAKCLAASPAQRFASAMELQRAIETIPVTNAKLASIALACVVALGAAFALMRRGSVPAAASVVSPPISVVPTAASAPSIVLSSAPSFVLTRPESSVSALTSSASLPKTWAQTTATRPIATIAKVATPTASAARTSAAASVPTSMPISTGPNLLYKP